MMHIYKVNGAIACEEWKKIHGESKLKWKYYVVLRENCLCDEIRNKTVKDST